MLARTGSSRLKSPGLAYEWLLFQGLNLTTAWGFCWERASLRNLWKSHGITLFSVRWGPGNRIQNSRQALWSLHAIDMTYKFISGAYFLSVLRRHSEHSRGGSDTALEPIEVYRSAVAKSGHKKWHNPDYLQNAWKISKLWLWHADKLSLWNKQSSFLQHFILKGI